LLKKRRIEEKGIREDIERRISDMWGVGIILVRNMIFNVFVVRRMDMRQRHAKFLGKILKTNSVGYMKNNKQNIYTCST
jgi:hypothetical protein